MNSEFINFEINIYRVRQNSFFSHLFLFKSKNQTSDLFDFVVTVNFCEGFSFQHYFTLL